MNYLTSYLQNFLHYTPWKDDGRPAGSAEVIEDYQPYDYDPNFNHAQRLEWITSGVPEEHRIYLYKEIQDIDPNQRETVIKNACLRITPSMDAIERKTILDTVAYKINRNQQRMNMFAASERNIRDSFYSINSRKSLDKEMLEQKNPSQVDKSLTEEIISHDSFYSINSQKSLDKKMPKQQEPDQSIPSIHLLSEIDNAELLATPRNNSLINEEMLRQEEPDQSDVSKISSELYFSSEASERNIHAPFHDNNSPMNEEVLKQKVPVQSDVNMAPAEKPQNQRYVLRAKQRFDYKNFHNAGIKKIKK